MSPQPLEVFRVFNEAAEISDGEQRIAYLHQVCGEDQVLRAEVEELLQHDAQLGTLPDGSDAGMSATLDTNPATELPGMMIGRYKLVREIGRGGMGVVYMAVQKEPVKRKVALKIIKPGMDTQEVVARFEAERQALAMMDHPCIAHVLDGGSTGFGRPYFVMELVDGTPITEYCDQFRYTTRQRLELFLRVCQAVQHAHLKGVIHRDIKPSNILVTEDDGMAVPKVIDFGIAKAMNQPLTDRSLHTQASQILGTPMYMSPEQADRTRQDVDTRTDVYSLGVLLYELLTGTTPFNKQRFQQSSFDEVKRIIREEEAPKPSTRLSTLGTELDTVLWKHHTDRRTLSKELAGDLDWVVLKAIGKDRSHRYQTVKDFAQDIQHYLCDEGVIARPPMLADRVARWARRHRYFVWSAAGSALVVFAILLASICLVVGAYAKEKIQRDAAEENATAARENAVKAQGNYETAREAVKQMLTRVADEELARIPEMKEVRQRLLEDAAAFYTKLIELNPRDPHVYHERAQVYEMLGLYDKVRADYQQAVDLQPDTGDFHKNFAWFLSACPDVAYRDYDGALLHARWAVRLDPQKSGYHSALAHVYQMTGKAEQARVEFLLAAQCSRDATATDRHLIGACVAANDWLGALERAQRVLAQNPDDPQMLKQVATFYNQLGQYENAVTTASSAIAALRKERDESAHPRAYEFYIARADAYAALNMHKEALVDYDKAVELGPFRSFTYKLRAAAHFHLKNYDQALADIAKAVELKPEDTSNVRWIPLQLVAKCPDQQFLQGVFELANKTVHLNPARDDAYGIRARLHAALGRREAAFADFNQGSQLSRPSAWNPGPSACAAAYAIHYSLLQPDKDRWNQALADLRQRLGSEEPITSAWLCWVSAWLPAILQGSDELPGAVFVSDLSWVRSTSGFGPPHALRDTNTGWGDGTTPVARLPYSTGILTYAFGDDRPADVVLDVTGRNFVTLKAHVGLCDNGTVQYQVLVDGELKHQTEVVRFGAVQPISVDVAGAKEVVLRVLNGGDGNVCDEAGWGYARFIPAGTEDPLEVPPATLQSEVKAKAAFFLAAVHWRLNHKELARRWYDKAVEWMNKNQPDDQELRRNGDEAAQLLESVEKPSAQSEQPDTTE